LAKILREVKFVAKCRHCAALLTTASPPFFLTLSFPNLLHRGSKRDVQVVYDKYKAAGVDVPDL
jgi:hypothetical protein